MDEKDRIKHAVLSELGQLSYLEKKKINEVFDFAFIEKEKERLQKQRRRMMILTILWIGLAFVAVVVNLYDIGVTAHDNRLIFRIISIVFYMVASLGYVHELSELKRRKSLYNILSAFARDNKV